MGRRLAHLVFALCLSSAAVAAATHRVLYVTATYGFRHSDSIDTSIDVFRQLARESGAFAIDHTEDVSLLTAGNLRNYDAVYFFTSGELPLSDQQKTDLLHFVRNGGGFGGSHSATDCLYSWPEYGEMIGAYFDGHPWTQPASVDVEDPQSPLVAGAAPAFRFTEEFYQFRNFSRDRVRVLLTLDTRTVDRSAPGISRADGDFALAWIRSYGKGRVFYSAFGHFPDSFRMQPVRAMLLNAMLWLTGQLDLDTTPRSGPSALAPAIPAGAVHHLAASSDTFAPGDVVEISGERLTSGSSFSAAAVPLPLRLAGTHVEVNGAPAPLFSVQPGRLLLQLPANLAAGAPAALIVSSVNRASDPVPLQIEAAAPSIVAAARISNALVLYVTGLGATDPAVPEGTAPSTLARTVIQPAVSVNGQAAAVFFSGLASALVGVYQINAFLPPDTPASFDVVVDSGGRSSNTFHLGPY